jgi:hypothetical protein
MSNLLIQTLGLLALLAAVAWGYGHWVRPRSVTTQGKILLLLLILTMAGGLIGSLAWWFDDPRAFAWDLPPLAGRMLAAAGWAFAAANFLVLGRPVTRSVRLVLLMLIVYLAPLAVAILLFHLDRFNWNEPVTYSFFVIVSLMLLPALWFLIRQPVIMPDAPHDLAPTTPGVKGWLIVVAVITGLWGLALFLADSGPANLVWVWPGDLLTSRLIGVMLLTIAVGAAVSHRATTPARIMLVVILVYGVGVALANLWSLAAGKPVNWSYVVSFAVMAVVSAVFLLKKNQDHSFRD